MVENTGNTQNLRAQNARPVGLRRSRDTTAQNTVRKQVIQNEGLDGYTIMSVRLRNAEFLDFSEQVERHGLKNNRALRIAARRISGFLEVDEGTQEELRNMTLMLGRIASAMNEMSRVAKQNQSVDAAAFLQERKNLGTEFARLETQLQYLLNVSKRRQDGNKRLQEANEDWQKNSKNELGRVLFTNRSFKSNG